MSTTTNSRSSLSRAWQWSIERSPLLNISRWILHRGYPNAKARDLINAANLPDQLAKLIDTTVTRTKLWQSERADIAKELIAHTQDALEAGRTPEHITESFGNPKKVAKLLRRSTKRKRPLYWRTLRNIRRAVVTLTLLIFLTYGSLAARFFIGKPNITKNYPVMINARNDAYTEEEKAWPIYKEVRAAWELHILDAQKRQNEYASELNINLDIHQELHSAGLFMYPQIPTDHHDYTETAQLFRDFKRQFDRLREATHRPIIGIELGFDEEGIFNEDGSYESRFALPSENPEENPSLINMLLPHLGRLRQFSNILYFDALLAARDGDTELVYQDLSAMLAMSRHPNHDGTLITDLVNIAMIANTTKAITQIIREHPGTLTREHLLALAHELTLCRPALDYSFEGEIMMFEDLLQRAYTDDSQGNGRITMKGMDILAKDSGAQYDYFEIAQSPLRFATGPISLTVTPDRKTEYTRYHTMMDTIKKVAQAGPELMPLVSHQEQQLGDETKIIPGIQYSLVDIIMPAVGSATSRSFMAHMDLDAAITMLAIEIYTLDHNQLPDSLVALTPTYLPSLPQDLHNPGHPLNYKRTDTPDSVRYILYSIGSDADDDDGTKYKVERTYPNFSQRFPPSYDKDGNLRLDEAGIPIHAPPYGPDGDWILIDMTHPIQTN